MSASATSTLAVAVGAGREQVLVVPRERALGDGSWHGLRLGGVDELLRVVADWGQFRPRSEVEHQPEWQQVIPHLVVRDNSRILTMRRLRAGSERRLRGQVTAGCHREWREEVVCEQELSGRAVGLLKDDAGEVGRVHLGVLILVDPGTAEVKVRERDKLEGRMAEVDELRGYYLEMETWSQFVYDELLRGGLSDAALGIGMILPRSPSALSRD